jgi:hypothetical protein
LPLHVSIETARAKPLRTWVMIGGQVTVPPLRFGRSIYVQDHTGGIQVYLNKGDYPVLAEGDWLRVSGRTSSSHGESRILVSQPADLWRRGPGVPLQPLPLLSGEVDELHEGLLVEVFGPAVRMGSLDVYLNDGSGEARVYVRESLGFDRPEIAVGEWRSVVGIVSQYVVSEPHVGGYRLLPRYETDLSTVPLLLPVTGAVMADGTCM